MRDERRGLSRISLRLPAGARSATRGLHPGCACFARHADYIHFNPVRHSYVSRVRDWPYSSFRRMVRLGVYPLDWAGDAADNDSDSGER